MKTILEVLNLSTQFLQQKGLPNPRRQAQDLLSRALSMQPMDLYLYFDRPLSDPELDKCRQWLSRRSKREPAAYIEGQQEFLGCVISINEHVLIPRPETEVLADKIVKRLSSQNLEGKILWDLCTGSGCLGIAIKRMCPKLTVVLSDVSSEALQVAAQNAKQNDVDVEFLEGDLFAPFSRRQADFVVCNPPYISEKEYNELDPDVRNYEPKGALVSGSTGLEFYHRLAVELPMRLKRPGMVWLEVGGTQGRDVENIFNSTVWKASELEKDWAGWDRFFFLEIE